MESSNSKKVSGEGKKAVAAEAKKKDAKKADSKKPGLVERARTYFKGVKSEIKRVTWPTKQDVLRWSVVVVAALVFFGVYVALLDNVVITPLLVAISGLGLGV